MFSKEDIIKGIINIGIKPTDTLLIHSSMKAIGEVDGGADTVLDAFMEYMKDGLLIFPTHTWAQMSEKHNVFDPKKEPSCVGLLTNLFRERPGVLRSWHPTHSVAAYGKDAVEYVDGEERFDSPCPWEGCWGRLYERKAKILFLGCTLKRNTFLHSVEELNGIPQRLTDKHNPYKILTPEGTIIDRPMRGHYNALCKDISQNYDKMLDPFIYKGIAQRGFIGDAESVLCDAVGMADLTTAFLKLNQDLFINDKSVPVEWYK